MTAERTAFAREIHDTVSHAVGLIAVQAAAAEVSWPGDPAVTRQALGVITATATAALADLDRLPPDRPTRPRRPADLAELIDRIRAGGTPVRVVGLELIPRARLDVAYRVLQESLTNMLRHGDGASAEVAVRLDDDLRIMIDDDGATEAPTGRGYGLIGLAERVGFAGGTVRAGPGSGGGYRVEVTLPPAADRVVT